MSTAGKTLVVLGGSGFIGRQVVLEAVRAGWRVKALARSEDSARVVCESGASAFSGEAGSPEDWIHEVEGADAIFDLLQPRFPKRVGRRQVSEISAKRQSFTSALVAALSTVHQDQRPILISVSGIDDLAADKDGYLSDNSTLRTENYGFSQIGIPVRKVIEQSKVNAAFVYLGTVYGPGKAFADKIFPSVAAGKWKNIGLGSNHMALIHVEDAARGLVRVAGSKASQIVGKSFVLTDSYPVEMKSFFELVATLMGVSAPGRIPRWLASLVAGRPLIETMICDLPIRSSNLNLSDFQLKYPSYREGLPVTLKTLGYLPVQRFSRSELTAH
ncbi:MAG: NAD(P)H-binding protein [Acidobacteriota bacterium]|nr:NAD(P)H-binding protein [Acidobacteriota bacterium]